MKQSTFTGRIRELRKKSGYTQGDVSKKLNIQRATYSNYENSLRTPPLEVVAALAELYDVSVDYLVLGVDSAAADPLSTKEKRLLDEFSELTEGSKTDVFNYIHFKRMFPS